jgi:hypothetical protein
MFPEDLIWFMKWKYKEAEATADSTEAERNTPEND